MSLRATSWYKPTEPFVAFLQPLKALLESVLLVRAFLAFSITP